MIWVGWLSSFILLLTIGAQVINQWRKGTSEGVSIWLFIGQAATSAGFVTYSVSIGDLVFIVTNALLLIYALVGALLTARQHAARQR